LNKIKVSENQSVKIGDSLDIKNHNKNNNKIVRIFNNHSENFDGGKNNNNFLNLKDKIRKFEYSTNNNHHQNYKNRLITKTTTEAADSTVLSDEVAEKDRDKSDSDSNNNSIQNGDPEINLKIKNKKPIGKPSENHTINLNDNDFSFIDSSSNSHSSVCSNSSNGDEHPKLEHADTTQQILQYSKRIPKINCVVNTKNSCCNLNSEPNDSNNNNLNFDSSDFRYKKLNNENLCQSGNDDISTDCGEKFLNISPDNSGSSLNCFGRPQLQIYSRLSPEKSVSFFFFLLRRWRRLVLFIL
jgi:hypothetical protein